MKLTSSEFDVINKIARKSKMDCWFCIKTGRHDGCPYDYVFDCENSKKISLRQGIKQLIDGVIEENILELTEYEKYILIKLLGNLI